MHFFLSICFILISFFAVGQSQIILSDTDIDSQYGITLYKKFNKNIYAEAVARMCGEVPCNGYVADIYKSGEKAHKGYYESGFLRIYKNFYPDGSVERDFKMIDDRKSNIKTFYPNGNLRSEAKYNNQNPIEWTDYYANGKVDFKEVYDKDYEYYIEQASFTESGLAEFELKLVKKKDFRYHKKEYFENGRIKMEGPMVYYPMLSSYTKIDWWTVYNESGKAIRKEEYVNGQVVTSEEIQ